MAQKNAPKITVIEGPVTLDLASISGGFKAERFKVVDTKDGKQFKLTDAYISDIQKRAGGIGHIMNTLDAHKAAWNAYALDVNETFQSWKKFKKDNSVGGGTSLPAFVNTFFDKNCPAKFGDPGTDIRKKVTSNDIYKGLDALIRRANEIKKEAARIEDLKAKGIDPKDTKKIAEIAATDRKETKDSNIEDFVSVIESLKNDGITEDTVSLLILHMGKKTKDGGLTKLGSEMLQACADAKLIKLSAKKEETKEEKSA